MLRCSAFTLLVLLFTQVSSALSEDVITAANSRFAFERAEMGLPFRITLFAANADAAKAAADAAFARIAELNAVFSDYDSDSELSRLSQSSGQGRPVPVSSTLWHVLERSHALAQQTAGAFDVTVGPLVNTWRRARRKAELPRPELIAEMKARVGYDKMRLNPQDKSVELLAPDMRLDLGAIAKGYAIDRALTVLTEHGIASALVAGGGDMAASGPPPGERGWRVKVASLATGDAPDEQVLLLQKGAVATSGDLFQRVEIGGKRYSHIVDPKSGLGLTDQSLVTVVAPDCITADSLATAISVLGSERGLRLVESKVGVEVRILRKPEASVERFQSPGWSKLPTVATNPEQHTATVSEN